MIVRKKKAEKTRRIANLHLREQSIEISPCENVGDLSKLYKARRRVAVGST